MEKHTKDYIGTLVGEIAKRCDITDATMLGELSALVVQNYQKAATSNALYKDPMSIMYFGAEPRNDQAAERQLLAAMINNYPAIEEILSYKTSDIFYNKENAIIFDGIVAAKAKSNFVSIDTIAERLTMSGHLEGLGGKFAIKDIANSYIKGAEASAVKTVTECYTLRTLAKLAAEWQNKAYTIDNADADTLKDEIAKRIVEIEGSNNDLQVLMPEDLADKALLKLTERIDGFMSGASYITGLESSIDDLNELTCGWQEGDLIIVAARPAMGKTSFMLVEAATAGLKNNKIVPIFSLEMPALQLINRMASSYVGVPADNLKRGNMTTDMQERMYQFYKNYKQSNIIMDDTSIFLDQIIGKCRALKRKHGQFGAIFIDYLQLISIRNHRGNREQEISTISRELKALAKSMGCPIIALSQLSRGVEARASKRPGLSDLRESGAIEQDADAVLFLYRPEYYNITTDEDGNSLLGIGEIIVAKNRSGACDVVKCHFDMPYTAWRNLSERDKDYNYVHPIVALNESSHDALPVFGNSKDDDLPF